MKVYSVSRLLLTGLTSLLLLIVIVPGIVFASSNDWSEVTRFTGSATRQYITDYFTCDHVDWRIRWEYTPEDASFIVYTYQQKQIVNSITEGAKVEVTLSWQPEIKSFSDAPDELYLRMRVDGTVTNHAEFKVYNVSLTFHIGYSVSKSSYSFPKEKPVNLLDLEPNETKQISEIFIYNVYANILEDPYNLVYHYDITWNQKEGLGGVTYIQNREGIFYMEIITDAESYTIIIEQDLNSIPEFSSWILLTLFLTATVFALVVRRRINHNSGL